MGSEQWLFSLRERLGGDGTAALCEALEASRDEVMVATAERFEKRLAEECGLLRVEMQQMRSDLRGDIRTLHADLRVEIAARSAEMMKWAFLFWIGQAATIGGLLTILR